MPYYVDNERRFAIWFAGTEWFIGSFSNIGEGKSTTGLFQNDEFVECPTDTNDWREYFDGEWNINLNAKLSHTNLNSTDYSKWRKYSGPRFE